MEAETIPILNCLAFFFRQSCENIEPRFNTTYGTFIYYENSVHYVSKIGLALLQIRKN